MVALRLLLLLLLAAAPARPAAAAESARPSDLLASRFRVAVRVHNRAGSRFVLDTELRALEAEPVIHSGARVAWSAVSPPTAFHKPELRGTAMYRAVNALTSFDPHEMALTWGFGGPTSEGMPYCHIQLSQGLEGGCVVTRNASVDGGNAATADFFIYDSLVPNGGSGLGALGQLPGSCEEVRKLIVAKRAKKAAALKWGSLPSTSFVFRDAPAAAVPDLEDGYYSVYPRPHGQPTTSRKDHMSLYCAGMEASATAPARDFLPLVNVGGSSNAASWLENDRTSVVNFYRLRINTTTELVDNGDFQFTTMSATGTNPKSLAEAHRRGMPFDDVFAPFGVARSCLSITYHGATASIDLRGTRYAVGSEFSDAGSKASKFTVAKSEGDQVVQLKGGGYCGWVAPTDALPGPPRGGWVLKLKRSTNTHKIRALKLRGHS